MGNLNKTKTDAWTNKKKKVHMIVLANLKLKETKAMSKFKIVID